MVSSKSCIRVYETQSQIRSITMETHFLHERPKFQASSRANLSSCDVTRQFWLWTSCWCWQVREIIYNNMVIVMPGCHAVRQDLTVYYGPVARYVKLRIAHAPGMSGTFSPPPRGSVPDMHHGTCATHVPWCMPWSQTGGFLWNKWRGRCSRHSRRMCNPQFYFLVRCPWLT